jgi:P27 family predicted phage terminase small subunit
MRGRKPDPTPLKLLKGNPGKRPISLNTFAPESVIPRCPAHLKGEARREWTRVTAELHKYNMIAEIDGRRLSHLCTVWARYVYAEMMIRKAEEKGGSGLFVKTPNGYPVQSPWLTVSNKAIEQYGVICAEFGMTPAARVRVVPQTTQLDLPGLEVIQGGKPELDDMIR